MEELLKELEEAKAKIAEIEKKIEEKKAEAGRWKPEEADKYWFINIYGQAAHDIWDSGLIDNKRYEIGNLFKTKEEAEFVVEKLRVIAELKGYKESKYRKWDGDNNHYHIYYNYIYGEVDISYSQIDKQNEIYFESREKAQQAIDAVGEERVAKYLLGVDLNE